MTRRIKPLGMTCLAAIVVACLATPAGAQTSETSGSAEGMQGLKVREIHPLPTPTPFPLDAKTKTVATLEFRAPEAMAAADRALAEENQAEIARRAGLVGFQLGALRAGKAEEEMAGTGSWGYEQAVCPAFPEHVILEYSRVNVGKDGGRGDVSLFSAVIPRGDGHVRVIPAQRRSFSLYTPVSANALTINDFNHMVQEEGTGVNPDWLTLGLCYSALASGHVRAALAVVAPADEVYPMSMAAKLTVSRKGGAEVRFAEVAQDHSGMDWILKFTQGGQLLKAKHIRSSELFDLPVAQRAVEAKGVPVRQTVVEVPAVP